MKTANLKPGTAADPTIVFDRMLKDILTADLHNYRQKNPKPSDTALKKAS